jgi:6-phosphogluconolactonase
MKNSVRIFNSLDALSHFFSLKVAAHVGEIPHEQFFSFVLSGGSTPPKLFSYLAKNFADRIEWKKVKVFWGDERCVGPQDIESNFRMAKENLLDRIPITATNIYRINGEADPVEEAARYAEVVCRQVPLTEKVPRFDFVMLGLGEDGHTASVFPEHPELFSCDKLYSPTFNPYTNQGRITATGKIINNAHTVTFVVTGKNKADMVARIIEKKEGWEKLPASLVRPDNGELFWLLDEDAASSLGKNKDFIYSKS